MEGRTVDGAQRGPRKAAPPGVERRLSVASEAAVVNVPAGYRVVDVETSSTPELKDLVSFRRDFDLASVFGRAWLAYEMADGEREERAPETAWFLAAVVSYARPFEKGGRQAASVSLDTLSESQKLSHERLRLLRNRYVSHATNGFEGTVPYAMITDSVFQPRRIVKMGHSHYESWLFDNTIADLVELSELHYENLGRRIHRLHTQIGDELMAMGLDAVYALPDHESIQVGSNVNRKRT